MTDKLGKIWLIGLLLAMVALSIYLWQAGKSIKEPSQETYLHAEAARLLDCTPYLISAGIPLDANENGLREYFFSCDSVLNAPHQRFIWMEIRKKKVHILLWHTEEGLKVGEGPTDVEGYSWLIDRGSGRLLALPARADTFAAPLDIVWNPRKDILSLGEPSD